MKPITALVVIKNEENNLKKCLKSIKGVCSHILIIHDGFCTDKSLDIAENFTKQIFVWQESNNPEFIKGMTLDKYEFKTDYVLFIDADERISKELKNEIECLNLEDYDVYRIKSQTADQTFKEANYQNILFNRHKIRFFGFYHNTPIPKTDKIKELKGVLNHKRQAKNTNLDYWAIPEAKGLINTLYYYYNFSKKEKKLNEFKLFLSKIILVRLIVMFLLFCKYTKKYGFTMALLRVKYHFAITKILFCYKFRKALYSRRYINTNKVRK